MSEDLKQADSAKVRTAKKKADFVWQMNLAQIKLGALKGDDKAARTSLQSFHDTARKSLWHAQRA